MFFNSKKVKEHLFANRGAYLYAPITILLLFGALYLYKFLTGRSTIEDVSALVGASLNAILLIVSLVFAKFINEHLFTCLNNVEFKKSNIWKRLLDAGQTVFCIILCVYCIFR